MHFVVGPDARGTIQRKPPRMEGLGFLQRGMVRMWEYADSVLTPSTLNPKLLNFKTLNPKPEP